METLAQNTSRIGPSNEQAALEQPEAAHTSDCSCGDGYVLAWCGDAWCANTRFGGEGRYDVELEAGELKIHSTFCPCSRADTCRHSLKRESLDFSLDRKIPVGATFPRIRTKIDSQMLQVSICNAERNSKCFLQKELA